MEIKNQELHRVTSTAIIYKKSRQGFQYLITQRSFEKKSFPGQWTVPGGGLEVADYINTPKTTDVSWYFAIEKSLRREIKEEVNLEVGKLTYLLDVIFIRPDGVPAIVISYYGPYRSGKIRLDEDSINYQWIACKELKNRELISGIAEEIKMVDRILKGKNNARFAY